jgi:hypothetical protein
MSMITVPNRPFATHPFTGLMLPDGFFEASLGSQRINAQFRNDASPSAGGLTIYLESVSNAGIVVTPANHFLPGLDSGAVRVLSWNADFTLAPPGIHFISFVAEDGSGRSRIIKKIFVTRLQFDSTTTTFSLEVPEGRMQLRMKNLIGPEDRCCPPRRRDLPDVVVQLASVGADFLTVARYLYDPLHPDFVFCPPGYLLHDMEIILTPTPAYAGQYGELPFQDPWWKIAFCIIAAVAFIAAIIVEAVAGTGSLTLKITIGPSDPDSPNCCGIEGEGSGTNVVAGALVAAAGTCAYLAGYTDIRDPFRRGQDNTVPAAGEITIQEQLEASLIPRDDIALGRPFAVDTRWTYTRVTSGATYTHSVAETNTNTHVLSHYNITAPDVIRTYRRESFIVQGEFFDHEGTQLRGDQLFVQCFLIGPTGEMRRFVLQDDGIAPDREASDGIYTGGYRFSANLDPRGLWTYFVIAQDINNAQPDMEPEEAAQIIGGMVVTHQLTITFDGGTCPLVPDGDVNVIH